MSPRDSTDGESQPLLADRHDRYDSDDSLSPPKRTPLPVAQLGIVLFLQLAEPLTSQVIYPFAPQLIRDVGITNGDETKVGYYVGVMQSLFFFTQAMTVLHWSRLSDRIGRKPVILSGLIGLSISMYCFGLSRTFWGLVLSRSLNGALNGNIGIIKSMIAEMTDATNIAAAYAYMPLAWSTGSILGPMIGGFLAHPTESFPGLFGGETAKGPSIIQIPSIIERRNGNGAVKQESLEDAPVPQPELSEHERAVPLKKLFTWRVFLAGGNYAFLSLVDIALRAVHPVFLATPIELGGLGMSTVRIGKLMSLFGFLNGVFQVFFFSPIHDWLGTKRMYNVGILSALPTFAMFPILSYCARQEGSVTGFVWSLALLQVILSIGSGLSYGAVFIYISSASPNRASLGATNGLCQLVVSLMRTIGPAAANSLFSLSIQHQYLNGWMVYYVLMGATCGALWFGSLLPKKPWVMGHSSCNYRQVLPCCNLQYADCSVGAGIGGLTLARILQLNKSRSLIFTIYDSDANASARAAFGGSLDLKYESGQRALKDAGLHTEFLKLCRPVGEQLRILNQAGKVFYESPENEDAFYNPEIDRGQLRALILDSLQPNTVQWGHKAIGITRNSETNKYTVEFASGASQGDVDIVVGADGAWSKVRPLEKVWPDSAPIYSGVTFLETKLDTAAHPEFAALVGPGAMFALGDGKGVLAQHNSGEVLRLYSAARVPEDWAKTSRVALSPTPVAAMLEDHFADWDPAIRELINAGENPIMRPIYALPYDSQPRKETHNIVLLGDAAHLMSPFAGEGVNLAMADAADLARVLVRGTPLEKYEALMRNRANEAGKESAENLELFFGENAAEKAGKLFKSFELPWGVGPMLKGYYFIRSLFA
ncbi:Major facilitator superfamily multidrug-resistance DHA1 sub-family [Mycena kentingensis (nom. inval.)]|nr:Major facilitator superfamily multidrug-resistance DHA1 sub-family [Mycena kentingensis (nom. inval.)]